MNNLEKVVLGGLLTTTVVSSNGTFTHADKLGETQYYLTNNLNMRRGPGTDYISVGTLQKGTIVVPVEYSKDKSWAKVKYNGRYVWICTSYIKKVENKNNDSDDNSNISGTYTTTCGVNVRKGPSVDYNIIGSLKQGTVIKALQIDKYGNWIKFKYNGKDAWVCKAYLKKTTQQDHPKDDDNLKAKKYTTLYSLNLRKGPSTSYNVVCGIPKGATVEFMGLSADKNWAKVKYNSYTGWVSYKYIKKGSIKEDNNTDKVIATLYTTANLNLRSDASTSSSIIGSIPKNSKVNVISYNSNKNWAKIKYNNRTGWVSTAYLKSKQEAPSTKTGVTTARLNLRKSAGVDGKLILTIPKGATVKILSESNGWLKVTYKNITGYCLAKYVK